MQQQHNSQDDNSVTTASVLAAASPAGQTSKRALAAMDAGLALLSARTPRHAEKLLPFKFAISEAKGREPCVAGTLFAASAAQAKRQAKLMAADALKVLGHTLHGRHDMSFEDCEVYVEARSMPLTSPPLFVFKKEDWLTYAAELIVNGAPFFSKAEACPRPVAARRPLRDDVADAHIRNILATDPEVRRARAARKEVSWMLLSGYMPSTRSAARVALHVTANDVAVPLSPVTSMAALSILFRVSNYNRKSGMIGHRDGRFKAPSSAVLRAALAASQMVPGARLAEEAEGALRYLRRIGLGATAQSVAAQAAAAVPAMAP